MEEINPFRVRPLNQSSFPFPAPFLELLFSQNGILRVIIAFIPDKLVYAVARRKTSDQLVLVLMDVTNKIIRHSDMEGAVLSTCHDVDVIQVLPHSHVIPGRREATGPESIVPGLSDIDPCQVLQIQTAEVMDSGLAGFASAPE
jgi:hypothetical protein